MTADRERRDKLAGLIAPPGSIVMPQDYHAADRLIANGVGFVGTLDVERPEIVCLCGSTRFYDDFQQANYDLTMAGRIVLSVGFYPHAQAVHGHGEGVGHDSAEKVALDELHKRKIDLADRVYVLNRDGYIGSSTRSEIEYAQDHGKPVVYAFDTDGVRSLIDGWPCPNHDESLARVGHHDCAALATAKPGEGDGW